MSGAAGIAFSPEEQQRYERQLRMADFGAAGQTALKRARVAVVGCGGLGSPALLYLAAAGVGTLGYWDADVVSPSNLQRQILHGTVDIGRVKVDSATDRLRTLNPHVQLLPRPVRVTAQNAQQELAGFDVVLDATDQYVDKYLLNDACCALRIPLIHAGLGDWSGQLLVIRPGVTPCLRCVFETEPPAAYPPGAGPIGPLPGVIGALMALETVKLLASAGAPADGTLLAFDGRSSRILPLHAARQPECSACANIPAFE